MGIGEPRHSRPTRAWFLAIALGGWISGCSCGSMDGDEGPVEYVRCGQADPPAAGSWSHRDTRVVIEERVLSLQGPRPFKVAAFEGPVGAPLSRASLAAVAAREPDVVFYLGGLGDDEPMARASLKTLASSALLVVFVPGGADRWAVVEETFDDLEEPVRQHVILGAGLRRIDIGSQSFAVMSGAPLGRYAIGEGACGFGPADVQAVQSAFDTSAATTDHPPRLLSWSAPSGWGLSAGLGRLEVGSPDLHILAEALSARGGLFAWPRGEGTGQRRGQGAAARWVVPRLSVEGSVSAEGAYAREGFAWLELGSQAP